MFSLLLYFCRYEQRRDFRFDHTGQAILSLFEVLTLEGWIDVRDMVGDPGNPTHWVSWRNKIAHHMVSHADHMSCADQMYHMMCADHMMCAGHMMSHVDHMMCAGHMMSHVDHMMCAVT